MEERKTAAIVLSILAFIAIFFFVILPYIDKKRNYKLSYASCSIDFKYRREVDTTDLAYVIAQNNLGLCLCNSYEKKHDVAVAKEIMKIYAKYRTPIDPDSFINLRYNNLDSVLKFKEKAFDPLIADDEFDYPH